MRMKMEDRWHCTNPSCGCEVLVETSAIADGENPHCTCGAVMKKRYASPVLSYLDFLHLEEAPNLAVRKE